MVSAKRDCLWTRTAGFNSTKMIHMRARLRAEDPLCGSESNPKILVCDRRCSKWQRTFSGPTLNNNEVLKCV